MRGNESWIAKKEMSGAIYHYDNVRVTEETENWDQFGFSF